MMDNAYDYILVMLLQRIDSGQSGLISEMISGVEADRQAIREAGMMTNEIDRTIEHTLSILNRASQESSASR